MFVVFVQLGTLNFHLVKSFDVCIVFDVVFIERNSQLLNLPLTDLLCLLESLLAVE